MKTGQAAQEDFWAPTGQVEWPWHPDWTVYAACRGKFGRPKVEGDDPFFDFPAQSPETLAAKNICYSCPVRMNCLKANLWVPFGIFGGYTERERRKLRRDHRDRSVQIGFFVPGRKVG